MNLIFGFLIFSTLFLITGIPVGVTNEIATVSPGSVASQIGLMPGDQLIAINGKAYNSPEKAIDFIHKSSGKELTLNILRNNKTILTKAIPEYNKRLKMGLIGFSLKAAYKKANIFAAVYTGLQQTIGLSVLTVFLLGKLFIGQLALNDLAGPIGIAQITGQYAHSGLVSFFNFMGFFSINVAIVNLLPIPALDGGRLFFVLLEAIRRKPISIETENKIHYIGLLFLLGLLAILTFNDLTRIFHN
jgi:regulator of sigma E protease